MSLATKVRTKTETQRRHQMDTLGERRALHQTKDQQANAVLHEADKADQLYAHLNVWKWLEANCTDIIAFKTYCQYPRSTV